MGVRYEMKCLECKKHYQAAIKDDGFNKKQVNAIKCIHCKSKRHIIMKSCGNWGMSCGQTSSKMDNFEYRAKTNMDKAQGERRAAEASQAVHADAYSMPDDLATMDEGVFDNDGPIRLS